MLSPSEQQRALRGLSALTARDLQAIFRRLNLDKPDRLAEPLAAVLEQIGAKYGTAAATLAADFYDEARAASGAGGSFRAIPAVLPDAGRFESLARWGIEPLFGDPVDPVKVLTLIGGGLQRVVANMHRDTVEGSAKADPQILGYRRHASANACAFCAMLATRTDYVSERSATRVGGRGKVSSGVGAGRRAGGVKARGKRALGSKFHDDCHCIAVPIWSDEDYDEPDYVKTWRDAYEDASGKSAQERGSIQTKPTLAEMRKSLGTN